MRAHDVHITGMVQGVGFRPFVFNLATDYELAGWVLNASDGVHAHVEGTDERLRLFFARLESEAPPMAHIDSIAVTPVGVEHFTGFSIRDSIVAADAMTLVSPDIATCPSCTRELFDANNRRYHYPFINCTDCGPRFTIIDDIPYDRPSTTMRSFTMCPECAAEYADPRDRRFHAQPDACFECGPRLRLVDADGAELTATEARRDDVSALRAHSDAIIRETADLLATGKIVAIKGLGGYQLACDASDEVAVQRLRSRKHRGGKPLAVMVRDVDTARGFCHVDATEADLLGGPVRPIVLLRRRRDIAAGRVARGVCEPLQEIGVMLPYTPLHHLLLAAFDGPLVMTSGNRSDEPIATDDAEAFARLGTIADAFLSHDRAIRSRYDDSVVRVVDGAVQFVRRARGYAPRPIRLPFEADAEILAVGPGQKNTFTLLRGDFAFVSQHIGDLENAETLASFEETEKLYERLLRNRPTLIAHDLHPEYLSTKWAHSVGLPLEGVQHHHAHVVSVAAENGVIDEPFVGIALDGTGYGTDGRIWGGEVLVATTRDFERFAHLRYVSMPGGVGAIRRPARMALGMLAEFGLLDHPGARTLREHLTSGEEETLLTMIERGVNCPLTSSMGRLFDAVAAIIGISYDASYEGEAAILLEACAEQDADAGSDAYSFSVSESAAGGPRIIEPTPVIGAILQDLVAHTPASVIARRFHQAVIEGIATIGSAAAELTGTTYVALAGGVFMNRHVLKGAIRELTERELTPLVPRQLPINDGGVSFGQAVVAWARRNAL